jgi:predicted ATPase
VNAWAFLSHILWSIGYSDQAVTAGTAGVALAIQLSDPLSLALAQGWVAWLRLNRSEPQLCRELSEQNIALATEQGFSFFLAIQTILRGYSLAQLGNTSEGITQICEGIAAYRATGAGLEVPHWFALLAGAYAREGRFDEGLAAVDEALSEMHKTGARYCEAELHRLRGELKLGESHGDVQTAEHCYREALEVAQGQGAKSWELRATTSLARLLASQGRRDARCSPTSTAGSPRVSTPPT